MWSNDPGAPPLETLEDEGKRALFFFSLFSWETRAQSPGMGGSAEGAGSFLGGFNLMYSRTASMRRTAVSSTFSSAET